MNRQKLSKCRFCNLGFTLEPFCRSRLMMSVHNLPYRLQEWINEDGIAGWVSADKAYFPSINDTLRTSWFKDLSIV